MFIRTLYKDSFLSQRMIQSNLVLCLFHFFFNIIRSFLFILFILFKLLVYIVKKLFTPLRRSYLRLFLCTLLFLLFYIFFIFIFFNSFNYG